MTPTLKPGWKTVKFGDVVRQVKDKVDPKESGLTRYIAGEHMTTDDLRLRRWGDIGDGYLGPAFHMRFKPGQVLYGSRRTYLRKVAVADFEGICANTTYVLESKDPNFLLPELLPFIMSTEIFHEHSIQQSKGSVNPYINFSDIAWYEFPLPPLDEQRRIAEILSSANALGESYLQLVEKNKKLWRALAFELIDKSYSCGIVRLGEVISYGSDGPFGSKLKTKHYVETGVRVIRLQNIDALNFNDADKAYIPERYYQNELVRYTVNSGDILIAGMGDDKIQAGRSCIAPACIEPAINKADCYCLRPGKKLHAGYLAVFLNSPQGLQQSMAFSQGTTRYRLNLGNIKRMKIPLPDINQQKEIAIQLERVFEAEQSSLRRYKKQREVMTILLNSLLGEVKNV